MWSARRCSAYKTDTLQESSQAVEQGSDAAFHELSRVTQKEQLEKSVEFELDHREAPQTVDDGGGDNQHLDVLRAETCSQHGSRARVAGADGRLNRVCADKRTKCVRLNGCLDTSVSS